MIPKINWFPGVNLGQIFAKIGQIYGILVTYLAMQYVYQWACKYNFVGTQMYLGAHGSKNHIDSKNILAVTRSNGVKWGQRKSNASIFDNFQKTSEVNH